MALLDSVCIQFAVKLGLITLYNLSFDEYEEVQYYKGNKILKFGNSKIKKYKIVKFPVIIAGVSAIVTSDVVEYDIPLLLSKEAMKKPNTDRFWRR